MEMLKRRNDTSHNYDEEMSSEVVQQIKDSYFDLFVSFYEKMNRLSSSAQEDLFSNQ